MVASKRITVALMFCICFSSYAESEKKLLIDEVGVLGAEAFSKIETHLKTVSQKSKSDAVVVIVSNSGDKTPQDYADDYFDYSGYGQGEEKEGSLLLIITGDGSPNSRYAHISTHGEKTIKTINDDTIEALLDSLIDGGLKENNYLVGIESYVNSLSKRFYNSLSILEIAISLIVGLLFFLFNYFGTIKKYKSKGNFAFVPFYDISKNSIVSFATNNDIFISTNTTSHAIQTNTSKGSGESTIHTSSSGETHGGGGRSF